MYRCNGGVGTYHLGELDLGLGRLGDDEKVDLHILAHLYSTIPLGSLASRSLHLHTVDLYPPQECYN